LITVAAEGKRRSVFGAQADEPQGPGATLRRDTAVCPPNCFIHHSGANDLLGNLIVRHKILSLLGTCGMMVLTLSSSGCSPSADDLPREAVWGKVSINGEPLARGAIRFSTSSGGGGQAMEVGELIRDGEYQIARSLGPVPGTYRVTITEEVEAPSSAGEAPGPRAKLKPSKIPAKYNAKDALTAEVKKGQADPLDFALKTN
jgi:hypothetical protein